MADLQNRLDAVFGGLAKPGEEQQWRPSTEQVFRVGAPIVDHAPSSDEEAEFEERTRREVVPGLAMDLAAEDEPDAEGFMPSTAFCRALDREEEYNDVDEIATGTYRGHGADALPPRNMEVLDDNVWEQRIAQQGLQQGTGHVAAAAMDTDILARDAPTAAATTDGPNGHQQEQPEGVGSRGRPRPASSSGSELLERASEGAEVGAAPRPALASGDRARGSMPKRVRFQGLAQQPHVWVPPHRREGYVPRDPDGALPPGAGETPSGRGNVKHNQRGVAQSRVPDHVQHPERYTLYTLDEPLVVGGGVGQLGAESHLQMDQAAAAAADSRQDAAESTDGAADPTRWQGAVGGGIQFRPKAKPAAPSGTADMGMTAGGTAAGSMRAAAAGSAAVQGRAVQLAALDDDEREGDEHGTEERAGSGGGGQGGDAEMQDAAAGAGGPLRQGPQFKAPRGARSGRGYRSKAAAGEEE